MGLIFGKPDVKVSFLSQWLKKYVPAILAYGENSDKKKINCHLADLDIVGMYTLLQN